MNRKIVSLCVVCAMFICTVCVESYGQEYEYDKLNRVTKIIYDDGSYVEYTYDANGNITKVKKVDNKSTSDSKDDSSSDESSSNESNSDSSNTNSNNSSNNNSVSDSQNKDENKTSDNKNNKEDSGKSDTTDNKSNNEIDNNKDNDDAKETNKNNENINGDENNGNNIDKWSIIYPYTFSELMEIHKDMYESMVYGNPLDKYSWLEYAYTLYYMNNEIIIGEIDKDVESEYIRILDYFMVNEFYREYIKFNEKIYDVSTYFDVIEEYIALEVEE